MKKNMSNLDRIIRTILAILVGILYYLGVISGTVAIILGIVAVVFLLTSIFSFCPGYLPFGFSTRKE